MVQDRVAPASRRRFVSLAAVVAIVLVAIVLIAQYGMHSLDRTVIRNQSEIDRVSAMAEQARIAQVSFKTEVQEWKNVLLRGYDAEDFATYHGALATRQDEVDGALATLSSEAAALGFETATLAALATAHADLQAAYESALSAFSASDPLSNRAVDAAVRGKDRPINDGFDRLVTEVKEFADMRRAVLRDEVADVSARMRLVLYVSLGVGVLLLVLAAFTAMRRDRPT